MTRKKKYRAGRGKQWLALLAILCLIGTMTPVQIKAQENGLQNGVCEHHTEHTADCGYREAVQEHACEHIHNENCGYQEAGDCTHVHTEECGEDGKDCTHVHDETCGYQEAGDCTHEHDDICGYLAAEEGSPCNYVCDICSSQLEEEEVNTLSEAALRVQALIWGLPTAEEITAERFDEVSAQLEAIDAAKAELSDEEMAALDFTRYEEAAAKLELLTGGNVNTGEPTANLSETGGSSQRTVLSVGSVGYTEENITYNANRDDNTITITGTGITGNVTYDKKNKILTLENATISTYVDYASNIIGNIGIYTEFNLTIKLVGKNVIKDQNPERDISNYGIRAMDCNLTIAGPGSLEVTSAAVDDWSYAILAEGDITFKEGCKVKAVSEAARWYSVAIRSLSNSSSITVDYGCVIEASCKGVENPTGISAPILYSGELKLTGERVSVAKLKEGGWAGVPATDLTELKTYSYVKIEPKNLYMPSVYEFSLTDMTQTITVENLTDTEISGLTVTIEGEDKDYFTTTQINGSIPAHGEGEFTVSVNQNLPQYDETFNNAIVKVSSLDGSISVSAGLQLVIIYESPESPDLSGTTLADATYTKGAAAAPLTIHASVSDGGTLTYRWATGSTEAPTHLTAQTTNPTFVPPTDTVGTVTYFCEVTNTQNGSWVTITSPMVTITVVEENTGNSTGGNETATGNGTGTGSNENATGNGNSGAVQSAEPSKTEAPVNASAYQILEGAEVVWTPGSSEGCTIRGNGEFSKFTGVKVDGSLIDDNNYTAREGSTIITLHNAYLKTLAAGTHTVEIVWTDGAAAAAVTINAKDAVPKTGESQTAVWLFAVTGLSGMGLLLTQKNGRKNKKALRQP